MRQVQVFRMARQPDGSFEKVVNGIAAFHQFGTNYEESESNFGNFTTAIIERPNGTIEGVSINLIQFVDPMTIEVIEILVKVRNLMGELSVSGNTSLSKEVIGNLFVETNAVLIQSGAV